MIDYALNTKSMGLHVQFIFQVMLNSMSTLVTFVKDFKEDCVPELLQNLHKGTHIQSINGCCLDGLSMSQVLQTIQLEVSSSRMLQLMVRAQLTSCAVPRQMLQQCAGTCVYG